MQIWNACANGMGGIDWQAVPLFAEFYGFADLDTLTEQLLIIKMHKPDTAGS